MVCEFQSAVKTYCVVKVGVKRGGNLVGEVGVLLRVVLHAKLARHLRHNAKLLEIHERRHQRAVVVVLVRAAALNVTRTQKDWTLVSGLGPEPFVHQIVRRHKFMSKLISQCYERTEGGHQSPHHENARRPSMLSTIV